MCRLPPCNCCGIGCGSGERFEGAAGLARLAGCAAVVRDTRADGPGDPCNMGATLSRSA
jgi:hypothetical protein